MSASPAQVRSFARDAGLPVGSRGLFSAEVIAEFNKGRRKEQRYIPGAYVPVTEVTVKGRKRPVKVNLQAVRDWAAENGKVVGKRGRVADSILAEYVAATK